MLLVRVLARLVSGLVLLGALLFWPAGTLDYWQAWLWLAALFGPMTFALVWFRVKDPELLERRMRAREERVEQRWAIGLASVVMLAGILLPALDQRFGWSHVPVGLVLAADVCVLAGYALFGRVMAENSYAGRTVVVDEGQQVITTGPYAWVRHPMYTAVLGMMLATPIALGSWWGLPPMLLLIPVLALRIRDEEALLREELAGYAAYCDEVRSRLVPGIW